MKLSAFENNEMILMAVVDGDEILHRGWGFDEASAIRACKAIWIDETREAMRDEQAEVAAGRSTQEEADAACADYQFCINNMESDFVIHCADVGLKLVRISQ